MNKVGTSPERSQSIPLITASKPRRIKDGCLNGLFVVLFLVILGLSSLPTIFYYTAETLTPTNGTLASNITVNRNFRQLELSTCNKPLIEDNNTGTCVPPCNWKPWNKKQVWEISGATFTACIIALLSFTLVLLTWFKIPQLWRFPHFIVVIMLGESTLIVSLVSVGTLFQDDVFCSSKFLPEALAKPTTFCKVEGGLIHYLEGSLSLWFVAYNIVVAKGLVFDKVQINQSHKLSITISTLVCWLLPIIPVIFVVNSKEGYSVPLYSNYCFPGSVKLLFYTAVLPENILFAIGVSFLYIVIWRLLQERHTSITESQEQARLRKNKMDNVVVRLILLMVCYAATLYLTYGGMCYTLNKAAISEKAITLYLGCLMVQPSCHPDYTKYISHVPLLLNYVAAATFAVSTVLFLAANEKARKLWKTPFHQLRHLMSSDQANTNTSVTHILNEEASDRQLLAHA